MSLDKKMQRKRCTTRAYEPFGRGALGGKVLEADSRWAPKRRHAKQAGNIHAVLRRLHAIRRARWQSQARAEDRVLTAGIKSEGAAGAQIRHTSPCSAPNEDDVLKAPGVGSEAEARAARTVHEDSRLQQQVSDLRGVGLKQAERPLRCRQVQGCRAGAFQTSRHGDDAPASTELAGNNSERCHDHAVAISRGQLQTQLPFVLPKAVAEQAQSRSAAV